MIWILLLKIFILSSSSHLEPRQLAMSPVEKQVNTYTLGNQSHPAVSGLEDGGFVVAWDGEGPNGIESDIYAQLFHSNGASRGTQFRVNTYTIGNQSYPAIAKISDGFVIVYHGQATPDDPCDILAQMFYLNGTARGSEILVSSSQASGPCEQYPSVAGLNDGGFVVVWQGEEDITNPQLDIYARVYNPNGTAQASHFRVNSYTEGTQKNSAVSAMANGSLIIIWQEETLTGATEIYTRLYLVKLRLLQIFQLLF